LKNLAIPPKGMGKIEKSIWKFELKFEQFWPYHQREMKNFEICHGKLKWKNLKFFIFEI
jgi:hypothetical protein